MKPVTKVDIPSLFSSAWNNASKSQHALSGFKCTGIHPYNPDAISHQVYAPNERFKRCVIDANEGVNNKEEKDNEDEDNNQDNNDIYDNEDNDGIDTEQYIERKCGNGDEDNITDTVCVLSIVEALQEVE